MIRCKIIRRDGYGFSNLVICAVRAGLDMDMGKIMVCEFCYGYGSRENFRGSAGENKDSDMDMDMDMVVKF